MSATLQANKMHADRAMMQRSMSADVLAARVILDAAAIYGNPAELSQRRKFQALMPEIYTLRNQGFTFVQITQFLAECKLHYQASTVRTYYSEMLAANADLCQQRMNEQILLMAEVRTTTHSVDRALVADQLNAIAVTRTGDAVERIERLFGVSQALAAQYLPPPTAARKLTIQAQEKTTPYTPKNDNTEPSIPVLAKTITVTQSETSALPRNASHDVQKKSAASPQQEKHIVFANLSCKPLQSGPKPIALRQNVPEHVYQPGSYEHPAIPGLMLNLEERIYGAALEILDANTGEIRLEDIHEKGFRIRWRKPIPMTPSASSASFVKMDNSLFPKKQPASPVTVG
jgi:hypothetical protein